MARAVVIVLSLFSLCGCATPKNPTDKEIIASIKMDNGINEQEANDIAWVYFKRVYGGCGMIGKAIDQGSCWKFQAMVGYAGSHKDSIFVDKKTAKIWCGAGPTIEDLSLLTKQDPVWQNTFFGRHQSQDQY